MELYGLLSRLKTYRVRRTAEITKYHNLDRVLINKKGITGDIIDVYIAADGQARYLVEADEEGPIDDPDAWNDVRFPQLDCSEDDIEPL